MEFNPLDKTLVPLLRKSLDAYTTRHTAIAENMANVETKGFRPLKVQFESELERALDKNQPVTKKTDPKHMDIYNDMQSVKERVEELDAQVNIEDEMSELAQNQIRFDFVTKMLRARYETIKMSIRGRIS